MVVILRLSHNTHHTVAMEEFVANVEREMGRVHSSVLKKLRIIHSIRQSVCRTNPKARLISHKT
jgi:hypothetical protein